MMLLLRAGDAQGARKRTFLQGMTLSTRSHQLQVEAA